MGLKEEIEVVYSGDATVHNRPCSRVRGLVSIFFLRRIEPSVMTFPANDDGQLGFVLALLEPLKRVEELGQLVANDKRELALLTMVSGSDPNLI